jgi:PAP2 superfamily
MTPRAVWSGRREAAIGLSVYALYLLVRRAVLARDGERRALANAHRVHALERRLGIAIEPAVQAALVHRRATVLALDVAYVTLNVALTVGWLALLHRRRDPAFHRLRRAAVLVTLGALPAFLALPTAPPRRLDGIVDTAACSLPISLDHGLVVRLYNPVAAMPSIHMAYAVVTAAGIAGHAAGAPARAAADAYPAGVLVMILATGNHFVLDAAAGVALAAAALRAAQRRPRP